MFNSYRFSTPTIIFSSSSHTRPQASDDLIHISFDLFCTEYGDIMHEERYRSINNRICSVHETDEEDEEDEDIDNIVNSDKLNSDDIENIDMLENVKHNIGLYVKKADLQFLEQIESNFDHEKGAWVFTPDTYKEEDKVRNDLFIQEKCMVLIRKLKRRFPRLYIQLVKKTGRQQTRTSTRIEIENEIKPVHIRKSISVYTLVLRVDFKQTSKYKALEVLKRSQPAIAHKLYHPEHTRENKETGEKGWLARKYEKDFTRAEKTVKQLLQYIY